MSNLPNPKDFKSFKADLSKRVEFDNVVHGYDLNKIYDSFQGTSIPNGYISKLFDVELLKYNPNVQQILKKYFSYSKRDDSLIITLKDNEDIKTIVIHRSKDKEGNLIKWKTLGSKTHIQSMVKGFFIFVVFGMAEIILCEILDISYIAFQSDSIALNLQNNKQWNEEIKPLLKNKTIVLLLDNDDSCRKTINPLKKELSETNQIIKIEMEELQFMDKAFLNGGTIAGTLPKGYDFRDWCNEIKNPQKIEEILKETLKAKI